MQYERAGAHIALRPVGITQTQNSTMTIKVAALFDLDGVIVDTESQYTQFWAEIGRRCALPEDDFAIKVKGQTLVYVLDTYFPTPEQQAWVKAELEAFELHMSYPYVPGACEFVRALQANGIPTAVVTSSNKAKMQALYRHHPELHDDFTAILTAEDTPRSKPAPDCFLIAAERLGADIRRSVVFEDSFNGLRAANASGAHVVGLSTSNAAEAIAPLAEVVIPDFTHYAVSDFLTLVQA